MHCHGMRSRSLQRARVRRVRSARRRTTQPLASAVVLPALQLAGLEDAAVLLAAVVPQRASVLLHAVAPSAFVRAPAPGRPRHLALALALVVHELAGVLNSVAPPHLALP